jgi:hypothetical protein
MWHILTRNIDRLINSFIFPLEIQQCINTGKISIVDDVAIIPAFLFKSMKNAIQMMNDDSSRWWITASNIEKRLKKCPPTQRTNVKEELDKLGLITHMGDTDSDDSDDNNDSDDDDD